MKKNVFSVYPVSFTTNGSQNIKHTLLGFFYLFVINGIMFTLFSSLTTLHHSTQKFFHDEIKMKLRGIECKGTD